jgi:hypothetical protein
MTTSHPVGSLKRAAMKLDAAIEALDAVIDHSARDERGRADYSPELHEAVNTYMAAFADVLRAIP